MGSLEKRWYRLEGKVGVFWFSSFFFPLSLVLGNVAMDHGSTVFLVRCIRYASFVVVTSYKVLAQRSMCLQH